MNPPRRRRFWRPLGAILAALGFLVVTAGPAGAHSLGSQFLSIFDSISPPVDGVRITLQSTASAPYVTVRVGEGHVVEIPGLEGEPLARIGAGGAFVNRRSPSLYLTEDPDQKPPRRRGQGAGPADWKRVASESVFSYFDPRAEWPHTGPGEDVRRLGRRTTIFRWEIPVLYDGQTLALKGHVDWVPAPLNVQLFVLPVPLLFVALWWLEPRIKPFVRPIGRALVPLVVAALTIEGVRVLFEVDAADRALSRLAPLTLLPGLIMVGLAARLLWRGDRRGYRAALAFGAYLLVFGLLRSGFPPVGPGSGEWLRRIELGFGSLVLLGGVLLVFITRSARPQAG
ncbi:MAG: hypothetical protein ACRDJF_06180 [Actinomycetota bacterium]